MKNIIQNADNSNKVSRRQMTAKNCGCLNDLQHQRRPNLLTTDQDMCLLAR